MIYFKGSSSHNLNTRNIHQLGLCARLQLKAFDGDFVVSEVVNFFDRPLEHVGGSPAVQPNYPGHRLPRMTKEPKLDLRSLFLLWHTKQYDFIAVLYYETRSLTHRKIIQIHNSPLYVFCRIFHDPDRIWGIFCRILSVSHNIVMNLNNVMQNSERVIFLFFILFYFDERIFLRCCNARERIF